MFISLFTTYEEFGIWQFYPSSKTSLRNFHQVLILCQVERVKLFQQFALDQLHVIISNALGSLVTIKR